LQQFPSDCRVFLSEASAAQSGRDAPHVTLDNLLGLE
jgi:hypothetical protein